MFSVAYDPGQLLKYTGGMMVCAGSVLMFLTRALKRSPRADRSAGETAASNGNGRASRPSGRETSGTCGQLVALKGTSPWRSIASILFLLALGALAPAENPAGPSFDWKPWRYLPVQDGGRRKPLDTLAWETFRSISNRAGFTESPDRPESRRHGLLLDAPLSNGRDGTRPPGARAAKDGSGAF